MTATEHLLPARETLLELYDSIRFLDAFHMTEWAWADRSIAERLSVPDLIFAGRLARNLGSEQSCRALFRLAQSRAPDDPVVLYFCGPPRRRNANLYQHLRRFELRPVLGSSDPDLEASWCVSHALSLAAVEDFSTARQRLEDADAFGQRSPWTVSAHALVALMERRWESALAHAELAWEMAPGLPQGSQALSAALSAVGRLHEAADRLFDYVEAGGQSFLALVKGLGAAATVATRSNDGRSARLLSRGRTLAPQLELLAPLADRNVKRYFAVIRADLARAAKDRTEYVRQGKQSRHPFYVQTAEHLAEHPDGERWLLPYDPVRQQHKTCLPAAIAAALSCFDLKIDHAALAQQVTYDGTPWWRVVRWAEENGFVVRSFLAEPSSIRTVLGARLPFVFSVMGFANAHACAAIGMDEGTGTFIVHDPGADGISEALVDGFARIDSPFGLEALVIAPASEALRVKSLPLPNEPEARALRTWRESVNDRGTDNARELYAALEADHPGSATGRYMDAMAALNEGQPERAGELLERLLAEWPESSLLQRGLLMATEAHKNRSAQRAILEDILEARLRPGIDGGHAWVLPHPELYVELSELLRTSATLSSRAESMLDKALSMSPQMGPGYHSLGLLLLDRGETSDALLPLRVACTLDPENDLFAQTHARTLRKLGRADEALAWLTARTKRATEGGGGTAFALLAEAEEEMGEPERALGTLKQALQRYPRDGVLAGMAATPLVRWGHPELAVRALETSRAHARPAAHHRAAISVALVQGRPQDALSEARQWHERAPADRDAQTALAELSRDIEGPAALRALLDEWRREHGDAHGRTDLDVQGVEPHLPLEIRQARLATKLAADPHDVEARNNLAALALEAMFGADEASFEQKRSEAEAVVREALQEQPRSATLLAQHAELAAIRGDLPAAIRQVGEALLIDPGSGPAIASLTQLAARFPERHRAQVVEVWNRVFESGAQTPEVGAFALLDVASHYGLPEAESAWRRWTTLHPSCPGLAEGWAKSQLNALMPAARARAVLPELEALAADRFPHRPSLRLAVANVARNAGRHEDSFRMLEALVRRAPVNLEAWSMLADLRWERREIEGLANAGLAAAAAMPWEPGAHALAIRALLGAERIEEAEVALESGLKHVLDPFSLLDARTDVLFARECAADAIELACEVSDERSQNAQAAHHLARVLERAMPGSPEVPAAYRLALSRAPGDWDLAAVVFGHMCQAGQLVEAEALITTLANRSGEFVTLEGARAELVRYSGQKSLALARIANVVRREPNYIFGWHLFMTWADEDQAWALAREVLPLRGAIAAAHPGLEMMALHLLEASDLSDKEMERRWIEAGARHARSLDVQRAHFQRLLRAGATSAAARILEAFAAERSERLEVEAWRVQLKVHEGDQKAALMALEKMWARPIEHIDLNAAIQALRSANLLVKAAKRLAKAISQDPPPSEVCRRALLGANYYLEEHTGLFVLAKALARPGLSFDARDELGFAVFMLDDFNHSIDLIALMRRSPEERRSHPRLWQATLRALHTSNAAAMPEWLADWRARKDLDQLALRTAAAASAALGLWSDTRDVARRGLLEHPPGPAAGSLTMFAVLASLELNDAPSVCADFAQFQHYLATLPEDDPMRVATEAAFAALNAADTKEVCRLHFASAKARKALGWSSLAWDTVLRARLGWWQRLWLKMRGDPS